jgi:hypothetical protein
MSLKFDGGSCRITVRNEDCSVVGIGSSGGVGGSREVGSVEEVQERSEDAALWNARMDREEGGVRRCNFDKEMPLVEVGLEEKKVVQREGSA